MPTHFRTSSLQTALLLALTVPAAAQGVAPSSEDTSSQSKPKTLTSVHVTGSVVGNDQMLLYGAYQGVSSNHSTSVKEVGVRYRYLY